MRRRVGLSGVMPEYPSSKGPDAQRTRPPILALLLRLFALVDVGIVLALVHPAVVVRGRFGEVGGQFLECIDVLGHVAALDALAVLADVRERRRAAAVAVILRCRTVRRRGGDADAGEQGE